MDYLEHSYANGEEECLCNFILLWQHGPNSGNLTIASIANMCQIQFDKINDTVLATFFRNVREKIETRMNRGDICSEDRLPTHNGGGACQKDDCSLKLKHRLSFFERMDQVSTMSRAISSYVPTFISSEGSIPYIISLFFNQYLMALSICRKHDVPNVLLGT